MVAKGERKVNGHRVNAGNVEVLRVLAAAHSISAAAKQLGKAKSGVFRHYKRFVRDGLLNEDRTLTHAGAAFTYGPMGGYEGERKVNAPAPAQMPDDARLHDFQLSYRVINRPHDWEVRRQKVVKHRHYGDLRDWQAGALRLQEFTLDELRIRLTSRSVLIGVPGFTFGSAHMAVERAIAAAERLIPRLESDFGITLSAPDKANVTLTRQHVALVDNAFAKVFPPGLHVMVYDERGRPAVQMDWSKGEPELEFLDERQGEMQADRVK